MRFGERARPGTVVTGWNQRPVSDAYGVATGGTSSTITDGGFSWTLLSFTGDGTLTVSTAGRFECLLVGGGGAAGQNLGNSEPTGGGGGGSAYITTLFLTAGTYTVDVGAGAATNTGVDDYLRHGYSSSVYNSTTTTTVVEAQGGGAGASAWGFSYPWSHNTGGTSYRGGYGGRSAAVSMSPLCFNGGASSEGGVTAGGGGGAGGSASNQTAGAGRTTTFTGASVTYGAGGGGGTSTANGATGSAIGGGGGGRRSSTTQNGEAGNGGAVYVRFRAN